MDLLKKIANTNKYFSERLPVAGVLFISLVFALFSQQLDLSAATQQSSVLREITLLVVVFSMFIVRQRVVDEFKDYMHDSKNYPNRPFQRGLVSKRFLYCLGLSALIIEIGAVILLSGTSGTITYLLPLTYSFLMAFEFFLSKVLESRFTLYFILHEIIFFFYAVWIISISSVNTDTNSILWVVAFILAMVSIEIARKIEFRFDSLGQVVKDTYSAVWGRIISVQLICAFIFMSSLMLSLINSSYSYVLIASIGAVFIYKNHDNDKAIKAYTAATILILSANGIVL